MNDNSNAQNLVKLSSFNFKKSFKSLLHYWWLFLASFIICFGCAFLFLRMKLPKTLVMATVLIEDENPMAGIIGGTKSGSSSSMMKSIMGGDANVNNEIMILKSESLCAKTISELGINRIYYEKTGFLKKKDHYNDSPIEVNAPKELFDTLSISMKFKITTDKNGKADITVSQGFFKTFAQVKNVQLPTTVKTPYGIFSVQTTRFYIPKHEYTITAMVSGNIPKAEDLMEDMTIDLYSKKTDGVYLDVPETNIDRGRDLLNTLIKNYNERDLKKQEDQGKNTSNFIDDRLSLIYKDLMGSEAEIEAYQKAHNVIDAELQVKTAIGNQNMSEKAVMALETQIKILGMVKDFLANPANSHDLIPFDGDSTGATGAIKAYNNLITRRMHLEGSARDNNQVLKELDNQISITRQNVTRGVDNAMRSLQIKLAKANSELSSASGDMSNVPSEIRDMRSLYRNQAIQNEIYIFLLQKREENALRVAAAQPKGKVVDAAYAQSKPISPKKSLVFIVAFVLALGLPLCILYILKLINNKFTTKEELAGLTSAPVIGDIMHLRKGSKLVALEGARSQIAERFRFVRGNVQFMMPNKGDKVILVTSSVHEEGKTFVAANVASSFASLGKKVALVDLNIRNPKIGEIMGISNPLGLTNYLSNSDITLSDIVKQSPNVNDLDIYVSGSVPPNPSELLNGDRCEQLLAELRNQYDVIVVDSAPIEVVSDTLSLTKWTDMIIYTTRAEFTTRGNVNTLNNLLNEGKMKNVGMVLNWTKGEKKNSALKSADGK